LTGPAARDAIPGRTRWLLGAVAALAFGAPAARAQSPAAPPPDSWANERTVTVYAGYLTGGSFTEVSTGKSVTIDSSANLAASFDMPIDAARQVQVFLSYQDSQLGLGSIQPQPAPSGQTLPIKVAMLHLGGTNFFSGRLGDGGYVVGGLGVTQFRPGLDGYSTEWGPSLNVGVGYQMPLGRNAALRFEARAFVTVISSESSLFCSGGCVYTLRGDVITQGVAQIGFAARF